MVVALAELVEAEGRALRGQAARLGRGMAMTLVSALLAVAGLGLLLWGLYLALATALGPAGAALVTGVVALLAAGVVAWLAALGTR